jgi:hypothetical protein
VAREQAFQLHVQGIGKQRVDAANSEHRRKTQRHPERTSQKAPYAALLSIGMIINLPERGHKVKKAGGGQTL